MAPTASLNESFFDYDDTIENIFMTFSINSLFVSAWNKM